MRRDIWNLPNVLTMGRIAVIPLVCWLVTTGRPVDCVFAAVLFGVAAITDWLDGYIARKRGLESLTGKFLDPLADKLLVMAVLITLIPLERIPVWFVIVMLAREISITALRALAAGEGIIIGSAWGGKWKAGFQFVGLTCLLLHYEYTLHFGPFDLRARLSQVGLLLMLVSLYYSLLSGWRYFQGFLEGIDRAQADGAA